MKDDGRHPHAFYEAGGGQVREGQCPATTAQREPFSAEEASTFALAALRCGMLVPQIEEKLIARGLTPEAATALVASAAEAWLGDRSRERRRAQRATLVHRLLSGILFGALLATFVLSGNPAAIWSDLLLMLLPLACIWFGDELGANVGGYHTDRTIGIMVRAGGWLVFLTYLVFAAFGLLGRER